MKIKLNINFRKFNDHDERRDSGYCSGLDEKNSCDIDVNRNDPEFEQVLTIYHEVTHAVIDILLKYGLDRKHKRIIKKSRELKKLWEDLNNKTESKSGVSIEEKLCRKIEEAIEEIFKEVIPESFKGKLIQFDDKKKKQRKRTSK
jgi:hypothetical protein